MGKQHDAPNVESYKAQNDGHETSSSEVPSNTQGREVPSQAAHGGDVDANAHDKKKAQNALHDGLKPKEGNEVRSKDSAPQGAA